MHSLKSFLQPAWPLVAGAFKRGQLWRPACEMRPPHPDVEADFDLRIPVSPGYTLGAQVFRSRAMRARGEPMPVVMCAHPYDNRRIAALRGTPLNGPPQQYRVIPQEGRPRFSDQTSWEAPDPSFWVPAGYAVVNLNLPGYGDSEGPATLLGEEQARAFFDAIEWVAQQPWCTGRIGLSGVSFLAISQYHVAACKAYGGRAPRGLCAISPWEGLTDVYRDSFRVGGVPEVGFPPAWWRTEVVPALRGPQADFIRLEGAHPLDWHEAHPLFDDFWRSKLPDLARIELPMLVCGSFSDHELHSSGSFRAFMESPSRHKYLYTHRGGKWDAYYAPQVQELTRRFFDCYVRGLDNGFQHEPRVRLEVRRSRDLVHEVRGEADWPLPQTRWTPLHLDARTGRLADEAPDAHRIELDAAVGCIAFDYRFAEDTELSGPMVLALHAELRDAGPGADAVVFCALDKLDADGVVVPFRGSVGRLDAPLTRGLLALSHRKLDAARSRPWLPVLAHDELQPLAAGSMAELRIALPPSSTFFQRGEGLRLTVATFDVRGAAPWVKRVPATSGRLVLHLGGPDDNRGALLAPRIAPGVHHARACRFPSATA